MRISLSASVRGFVLDNHASYFNVVEESVPEREKNKS
jgi:hypothetical protein